MLVSRRFSLRSRSKAPVLGRQELLRLCWSIGSAFDVRGDPLGQLVDTDLPGGDANHRRDNVVGVLQSPRSSVDHDESPHRHVG